MNEVIEAPELVKTDDGDHEKLAHYYDTRVYSLVESIIAGKPITALCGKVWIPTRDPAKFSVCPECKAIVDYRSRD